MLSIVRHLPTLAAPASPAARFRSEGQRIAALVEALRDSACYSHPVDELAHATCVDTSSAPWRSDIEPLVRRFHGDRE